MTKHRLYFSHSYELGDLPFNEHLCKLLMTDFYTWIDSGREPLDADNGGPPGARRPMDISFNEWMMSQCDGFLAIAPNKRQSPYQALEYRIAVRMGMPRLVALQQGGTFAAPNDEIVELPTSWTLFWHKDKQDELERRIADFVEAVDQQKSANDIVRRVGYWRPQKNMGMPTVAVLQPRVDDVAWREINLILQRSDDIKWLSISPMDIRTEQELFDRDFDILVVDVGPHGTPPELLGFMHALGVPQIRLCRVENDREEFWLGRYLGPEDQREHRLLYEQDPQENDDPRGASCFRSVPRFLDGTRVDERMQPVLFWTTPKGAADQILRTMQRVSVFRSGRPPAEGGIAETIATHQSAKRYFDEYYDRAGRALVFISFSKSGDASPLADRLAKILRFLNLRCFHYRDEYSHSDGRLESGEDVEEGLRLRVDQADVIIYLIEGHFSESKYCLEELEQGVRLRNQGRIELRAYRLPNLRTLPNEISGINPHEFREGDWLDTTVEQKIVDDVQKSVAAIGWALRESHRKILGDWLKEIERNNLDGILRLLGRMGVEEEELGAIRRSANDDDCLDAILRLPKDSKEQKRARQIATLLLLAVTADDTEKRKTAVHWLRERRLLSWPPVIASDNEEDIDLDDGPVALPLDDLTEENLTEVGQLVGRRHPAIFSSRRPARIRTRAGALGIPIEWARESQQGEPIAVRRSIRWHLSEVNARSSVFTSLAKRELPPTTLILGLEGPDIDASQQVRRLKRLLRDLYDDLGWPPELVTGIECANAKEAFATLDACKDHVVHVAGHMGGVGLQVDQDLLDGNSLTVALQKGNTRLVILNGCEGGKTTAPLATDYLTLADRLIRDAGVAEVVAHRGKISESDASAFSEAFFSAFYNRDQGFDPARAAFKARKSGSWALRYLPVVISQR